MITIFGSNGGWSDDKCDQWGWPMCEFPPCPQGWTLIRDSCYNFTPLDATFEEAVDHCTGLGAKVVEPKNADEDGAIFDLLDRSICKDPEAPKKGCYQYWLGVQMATGSER